MPVDHDPSFVALFVENQRRIYGYILTVVPDCNEADDLFQQTSLVLWEKAGEFRPEGDFVRWACGVAFNVIRNYRVKKRRDRHCFSEEMMAQLAEVRAEKSEWLEAALAGLAHVHEGPRPLRPPAADALLRGDTVDPRGIRGSGADGELRLPAFAPYPRAVAGVHRAKDSREGGAMTQAESQYDPLREYAEQYCSGTLSAEQTAALEQRLRDDPRAMEFFVLYMEIHSQIAWEARARGEHEGREKMRMRNDEMMNCRTRSAFRLTWNPSLLLPVRHSSFIIHSFPPPLSPRFVGGILFSYLVAALIVGTGMLIAAAWKLPRDVEIARQSVPRPQTPARPSHRRSSLSAASPAWSIANGNQGSGNRQELARSQVPRPQSLVSLGDKFALASGLMEITYDTGAKVILQGPVTYEVESAAGGYLSWAS